MDKTEPWQLVKLRRDAKNALDMYAEGYDKLKAFTEAASKLKLYLDMHPEYQVDSRHAKR